MIVDTGDTIITWLVLASHAFLIVLGLLVIGGRLNISFAVRARATMWNFLSRNAAWLALAVSGAAMLGSLFYEHIAGYPPCMLCWWQRIFIYPQVFLILASKTFRLKHLFSYLLVLSSLGIIIAGFHYGLQIHSTLNADFTSTICSATDAATSCAQAAWFKLGYITIPFMALSAFFLQLVFVHFGRD